MLSAGFKVFPYFCPKLGLYFTVESGSDGSVVKGLIEKRL